MGSINKQRGTGIEGQECFVLIYIPIRCPSCGHRAYDGNSGDDVEKKQSRNRWKKHVHRMEKNAKKSWRRRVTTQIEDARTGGWCESGLKENK